MSATTPLAFTGVEDALWRWAYRSAGVDPRRARVTSPRRFGESRGPSPKIEISLLSLLPVSQAADSTIPLVMQQRVEVLPESEVSGGEVGVDFYPGYSFDPQRISVIAAPADPTTVTVAALLAQLVADLPAPYTAELEPSRVVLPLAGVEGTTVEAGAQVTLDSDGPGAQPWTLVEDVVIPGDGLFVYALPGSKAAPASSSWSIATAVPGWNGVGPNAADAFDASSVLIKGTTAEPLFATYPADTALAASYDIVSRFTIFSQVECVVVWRIDFRAAGVSGAARATRAAANAEVFRKVLDREMLALGFRSLGTANFAPLVPLDRNESVATLDVRFQGIMTGARTATPMRRARTTGTFSPA